MPVPYVEKWRVHPGPVVKYPAFLNSLQATSNTESVCVRASVNDDTIAYRSKHIAEPYIHAPGPSAQVFKSQNTPTWPFFCETCMHTLA
jgi:hypothetical protein